MKHVIAALLTAVAVLAASPARAQELAAGPGPIVVTIIPGGATFFTEGENGNPSFGNYDLGAGVGFNFNRYVGVEAEVSGAIGVTQDLQIGQASANLRTPNFLNYSGNLVVSAPTRSSVVPYATGGIGGLSLFEKASLGIDDSETFLTGNVGGGVKWFAGRWGLRGDYRFMAVQSKDEAPVFFGRETRYGHRVYGSVLLNVR
jgi:Outer membrane protein beta-barrel domain